MGGNAFLNRRYPPMAFPRMPTPQYNRVKAHVTERLLGLFHHAGVGIEAPEKFDHGDVDFVVCRPRAPKLQGALLPDCKELIEKSLGARFGRFGNQGALFLAIPMSKAAGDEDADAPEGDAVDESQGDEGEVRQQDYVQIDIVMCAAPSLVPYALFNVSYGDLADFLKTGTRPFGLSFRHSGLWMRVPGTDETDVGDGGSSNGNGHPRPTLEREKKSLIFLSNDVDAILSFLGLDPGKWKEGFASLEEIFEFAVSSKWFSRDHFGEKGDEEDSSAVFPPSPSARSNTTSASTNTATSARLGSYEKYKAKKRSVWNTFVVDFLPLQILPNDPFARALTSEPSPTHSQPSERLPTLKRHDSVLGSPMMVNFSPRVATSASSSVTLSFSDGEEEHNQGQRSEQHQSTHQDDANDGRGAADAADDARSEVLAAALSHFPGAAARYHALLAKNAAAEREKLFWERVKAELRGMIAQRQREREREQEQWQQANQGAQENELQRPNRAASELPKVSNERVKDHIMAFKRYTTFECDKGNGHRGVEFEHVGLRMPRLRHSPELDEAKFVPWTSTFIKINTSMTDDDLMAFVSDNFDIAYELDRARTRPGRESKRQEAARRKAERREQREREAQEMEREHERARQVEEERQERTSEGL
ncbi:hypothetical protein IWZ01DRAFT_529785 [Phyllosticta capitalensis]